MVNYSSFYGFTKNETTNEYLLVLRYFENGDLRNVLQRQGTTWKTKIEMIWHIAYFINKIHQSGMIHR